MEILIIHLQLQKQCKGYIVSVIDKNVEYISFVKDISKIKEDYRII